MKKALAPMHVGASKEAIKEARAAIVDILKTSADQATKVAALEALKTVCQVNGTTISNNSFQG